LTATADSRQRGPNILAAAAAFGAPIEVFGGGGTKKFGDRRRNLHVHIAIPKRRDLLKSLSRIFETIPIILQPKTIRVMR